MSRGSILLTFAPMIRNEGEHTDLLRASGYTIVPVESDAPLTAARLLPHMRDAVAIVAGGERIDADLIAAAPRMRVISRHGVGYDNVDIEAATRARIPVTITPGTNHVAVAELAMAMMIALARHIVPMRDALQRGEWTRNPGIELAGKTLGIVGLGRIGKALAVRARAFEMRVLASDPDPDRALAGLDGIELTDLDALLSASDFVSLHAPATGDGAPLVRKRELDLMKREAYLVNTARGSLIDETALESALRAGRIAGAALDVFSREPPRECALLTLPNVLATPHIGGTLEAGRRTALLATRNALEVLAGGRCEHTVNPEAYT
ncbi:MAG: phosphoglycerate dehydrogenase [Burkholderiales bacterium]